MISSATVLAMRYQPNSMSLFRDHRSKLLSVRVIFLLGYCWCLYCGNIARESEQCNRGIISGILIANSGIIEEAEKLNLRKVLRRGTDRPRGLSNCWKQLSRKQSSRVLFSTVKSEKFCHCMYICQRRPVRRDTGYKCRCQRRQKKQLRVSRGCDTET